MGRFIGSWLSGPDSVQPGHEISEDRYRGEQLGLPEQGPGSLAGFWIRFLALLIDWLLALGLAALIVSDNQTSSVTLLVWMVIGIVAVTLFGFTPGQFFVGLRVARLDGSPRVGFVPALGRQLLLALVIPAFFTDLDGRGMQDRSSGTAIVRR